MITGIVILGLRMFTGGKFFKDLAIKMIPVICVIVVKTIVEQITSKIVFLNRKSKILAVDVKVLITNIFNKAVLIFKLFYQNFRAFNIFLYFMFFFDCFMGLISAIIRLVKAVILAVVMMPSKILF